MFRHQGKLRTEKHNLQIAILLSFVAGMVNVTGFLFIHQLTTNVTGHFALFINDLSKNDFWGGFIYLFYIVSFLSGSFTSSFLIENFRENKRLNIYVIPIIIESLLLICVPFLHHFLQLSNNTIACVLLFTMGIQNSYVTKISDAVVRTTHLTGLFTDLGIDLSHLFFPKVFVEKSKLYDSIRLRIFIISFFLLGGLCAAFLYTRFLKQYTLIFAAIVLLMALVYDDLNFRMKQRTLLSKTE